MSFTSSPRLGVDVRRLVDVEDLAVEVPRRLEVAGPQRRLEPLENVVEVLLEAGAGEEVEDPP